MEDLKRFVPNVYFEQIPIKNLVSNQDYQRNLSQAHIDRAAEHFDLYQINPVKVSRRNGINYVFNGQHTIEIVARVSGSRETPVWCMIYDDLNYEHEADIFANQQKFVKSLAPLEVFKANIEAGNEEQLTILKLVRSYGCLAAVSLLLPRRSSFCRGQFCLLPARRYYRTGISVLLSDIRHASALSVFHADAACVKYGAISYSDAASSPRAGVRCGTGSFHPFALYRITRKTQKARYCSLDDYLSVPSVCYMLLDFPACA